MCRRYWLWMGMAALRALVLLPLFHPGLVLCNDQSVRPPHILMVLADDYGWHDIGYHGSDIQTPVMDQLAAEGVKLENYYVQPVCSPSRSQLLSGRYQIHTGLQHRIIWSDQPNGLPLELPTIADKLREVGYATHIVGKWHLGFYKKEYTPLYRGFDSFYGFLAGRGDYYTHERCERYAGYGNVCGLDLRDNEEVVYGNNEYSAHLFARKAIEVVAKHNSSKPLFLYLSLQSVHGPKQVPSSYKSKYHWIHDTKRKTYAGMVAAMDETIANVTAAFRQYGLWNNTVMVFSTDNGGPPKVGANNWPLRGEKNTLWEGGVRGVGFVHGLLNGTEGTESHQLVHISDWYPTFLHLAGASTNGTKLDGFNVWETISQNKPSPRHELLHNIDPLMKQKGKNSYPGIYDVRVRSALRRGDWKIITGQAGKDHWQPHPNDTNLHFEKEFEDSPQKNVWLFNITADPQERTDLSDSYPDVVTSLLQRLAFYAEGAAPCRYPPPDPESNPARHGGVWGPWQDDSLGKDSESGDGNTLVVGDADTAVVGDLHPGEPKQSAGLGRIGIILVALLAGLLLFLVVVALFIFLVRCRRRLILARARRSAQEHD